MKPETRRLFDKIEGAEGRYELAARLQYGAGLRLSELVRLRVKDVDLERGTVTVRQGKGDKERMSVLPKSLLEGLARQVERARELWQEDRNRAAGSLHPGCTCEEVSKGCGEF